MSGLKLYSRLRLITFAGALLPLLLFALFSALHIKYPYALLLAAAAGAGAALFSAAMVKNGLAGPVSRAAAGIKKFIAAGYRLETAAAREGWPEVGDFVYTLNRLMLELAAYRAFRLNQVVEERGKAQALIETITDGVLLLDDKGGVIWANKTALKLLGICKVSPEITLPSAAENKAFSAALSEILASDEKFLKLDVEVSPPEGKSGPVKDFQLVCAQFLLAALKRPGHVVIIRDITSEKELEKTKETFFQMVTHDMRAPLGSIQGYTELLKPMVEDNPNGEKCVQSIMRSSRRLNRMIDDILTVTKLERGSVTLQLAPLEGGALLKRVMETYTPEIEQKKLNFAALPALGKIEFTGDGVLLERVVGNLVGNSIKFTPTGGTINLGCAETADSVRFSVEDTGPGIPEDKREVIFNKYVQMEEHSSFGFGLGLAMCRMAVELHKGRIWVESAVGAGSKFIFVIPKSAAAPAASGETPR